MYKRVSSARRLLPARHSIILYSGRARHMRIHNFDQFTLIKRPLFAAGPQPPRARSVPRVVPTVYTPSYLPSDHLHRPLCWWYRRRVSLYDVEPHGALAPAARRPLYNITRPSQAHVSRRGATYYNATRRLSDRESTVRLCYYIIVVCMCECRPLT